MYGVLAFLDECVAGKARECAREKRRGTTGGGEMMARSVYPM